MSRTYKDRLSNLDFNRPYLNWPEPSWFKHMYTTKRNRAYFQRTKSTIYKALDLDSVDIFNVWNKPHTYYW